LFFTPGTPQAARALAAQQAGVVVRHNYASIAATAVTVPNANALNALRSMSGVVRVIANRVISATVRTKPPKGNPPPPAIGGTRQIYSVEVQRVGLPTVTSDGTGIGVAVVDSGIDFNHPDLKPAPNTSSASFNALSPGGSCQDDGGHGTHISGMIAARNNDTGIAGVAPGATVYCVKVLNSLLQGTEDLTMAGLDWVLQNHDKVTPPIRVVNISLGRPLAAGEDINQTPLLPLIQALYNLGIVVVAAAGNDPTIEVTQVVPAGYSEVLAVAGTVATNGIKTCDGFPFTGLGYVRADTASGLTTDGTFVGGRGVTISAPAEERSDIVQLSSGCSGLLYGTLSTTMGTGGATRKIPYGGGLLEARGTSFSAALVSGVVARIMQKQLVPATHNAVEVEGIRAYIRDHADRTAQSPVDPEAAPFDHPWAGVIFTYTFDGEREGIVQAPQ
jgi:subtilisin family serine protease